MQIKTLDFNRRGNYSWISIIGEMLSNIGIDPSEYKISMRKNTDKYIPEKMDLFPLASRGDFCPGERDPCVFHAEENYRQHVGKDITYPLDNDSILESINFTAPFVENSRRVGKVTLNRTIFDAPMSVHGNPLAINFAKVDYRTLDGKNKGRVDVGALLEVGKDFGSIDVWPREVFNEKSGFTFGYKVPCGILDLNRWSEEFVNLVKGLRDERAKDDLPLMLR